MSTLRNAAILLGISAVFGVFQASPSQANTTTWGKPPSAIPIFPGGDTEGNATFKGLTGPNKGGSSTDTPPTSGQFTYSNPIDELYTANLNFNPGYNTGVGPASAGVFEYSLTHNIPGYYWTSAALTSQVQAVLPGAEFNKLVCSDSAFTLNCVSINTTNSQDSAIYPLSGFGNVAYVRDTYYTTNSTAQITGITNGLVATPGPLPIFGAGAFFGFSRKLRSRIKASA